MKKVLLLAIANDFFASQGTVTTLEAKNEAWARDSNIGLNQYQTSSLMAELAKEENWDFTLGNHNGNVYKIYTPGAAAVAAAPAGSQNAAPVVNATSTPSGKTLDKKDGEFVGYIAGHPELHVQATSLNEARSLAGKTYGPNIVGFTYDDARRCSFDYFVSKYKGLY